MNKFVIIIIALACFSACSVTTSERKNRNIFAKTDLILPAITIINPAVAVTSFVTSTNTIHKVLSLGNLAYSHAIGNSFAEQALSQAVKKDCKLENLSEHNNMCL